MLLALTAPSSLKDSDLMDTRLLKRINIRGNSKSLGCRVMISGINSAINMNRKYEGISNTLWKLPLNSKQC